jgi:hypothetical protein
MELPSNKKQNPNITQYFYCRYSLCHLSICIYLVIVEKDYQDVFLLDASLGRRRLSLPKEPQYYIMQSRGIWLDDIQMDELHFSKEFAQVKKAPTICPYYGGLINKKRRKKDHGWGTTKTKERYWNVNVINATYLKTLVCLFYYYYY